MARIDNYALQVQEAKKYYLRYDQQRLIQKLKLRFDDTYLYVEFLCKPYRIHRETGDLYRMEHGQWMYADSHGEVMTILDLVCDSREDRCLCYQWESMATFGLKFHQNLLEDRADPFAQAIQDHRDDFVRACRSLRGQQIPGGDLSYAVDFFDGMAVGIQFWEGDEEFSPRVRFLWDGNALMYLKYETMHFAIGFLKKRILEEMKTLAD